MIKKENNKYLPGYKLQENLKATTDIEDISNSDLIIFCIPSDSFRDVVVKSKEFIKPKLKEVKKLMKLLDLFILILVI